MAKRRRAGRKRRPTAKVIAKLLDRATREGYKYGRLFGTAEDAGYEYVTRLLEGKHSRSTVTQAIIDMARAIGGRKGHDSYEAAKAVALAIPVEPDKFLRLSYDPTDKIDNRIMLTKLVNNLELRERIVVILWLHGWTYLEIAEEFELSQARIHQIWHSAVRHMKQWTFGLRLSSTLDSLL
jgi:RNA polymerase sigma factor (sigma-70 family)